MNIENNNCAVKDFESRHDSLSRQEPQCNVSTDIHCRYYTALGSTTYNTTHIYWEHRVSLVSEWGAHPHTLHTMDDHDPVNDYVMHIPLAEPGVRYPPYGITRRMTDLYYRADPYQTAGSQRHQAAPRNRCTSRVVTHNHPRRPDAVHHSTDGAFIDSYAGGTPALFHEQQLQPRPYEREITCHGATGLIWSHIEPDSMTITPRWPGEIVLIMLNRVPLTQTYIANMYGCFINAPPIPSLNRAEILGKTGQLWLEEITAKVEPEVQMPNSTALCKIIRDSANRYNTPQWAWEQLDQRIGPASQDLPGQADVIENFVWVTLMAHQCADMLGLDFAYTQQLLCRLILQLGSHVYDHAQAGKQHEFILPEIWMHPAMGTDDHGNFNIKVWWERMIQSVSPKKWLDFMRYCQDGHKVEPVRASEIEVLTEQAEIRDHVTLYTRPANRWRVGEGDNFLITQSVPYFSRDSPALRETVGDVARREVNAYRSQTGDPPMTTNDMRLQVRNQGYDIGHKKFLRRLPPEIPENFQALEWLWRCPGYIGTAEVYEELLEAIKRGDHQPMSLSKLLDTKKEDGETPPEQPGDPYTERCAVKRRGAVKVSASREHKMKIPLTVSRQQALQKITESEKVYKARQAEAACSSGSATQVVQMDTSPAPAQSRQTGAEVHSKGGKGAILTAEKDQKRARQGAKTVKKHEKAPTSDSGIAADTGPADVTMQSPENSPSAYTKKGQRITSQAEINDLLEAVSRGQAGSPAASDTSASQSSADPTDDDYVPGASHPETVHREHNSRSRKIKKSKNRARSTSVPRTEQRKPLPKNSPPAQQTDGSDCPSSPDKNATEACPSNERVATLRANNLTCTAQLEAVRKKGEKSGKIKYADSKFADKARTFFRLEECLRVHIAEGAHVDDEGNQLIGETTAVGIFDSNTAWSPPVLQLQSWPTLTGRDTSVIDKLPYLPCAICSYDTQSPGQYVRHYADFHAVSATIHCPFSAVTTCKVTSRHTPYRTNGASAGFHFLLHFMQAHPRKDFEALTLDHRIADHEIDQGMSAGLISSRRTTPGFAFRTKNSEINNSVVLVTDTETAVALHYAACSECCDTIDSLMPGQNTITSLIFKFTLDKWQQGYKGLQKFTPGLHTHGARPALPDRRFIRAPRWWPVLWGDPQKLVHTAAQQSILDITGCSREDRH